MARELIDLLWRDHPAAPRAGARGPQARLTTSRVVEVAAELADAEGLSAITVRRIAAAVGVSTMSLYTYAGSREDLLVLMADAAFAALPKPPYPTDDWRDRVRHVAETNLALHVEHAWLLDITDQRMALGPGTIAKYDHELRALDALHLSDVDRDAALTFVLDVTRSAAQARRPDPNAPDMPQIWSAWQHKLATYLGPDHPLAQRVGTAAAQTMNAPHNPHHSWPFALTQLLAALSHL